MQPHEFVQLQLVQINEHLRNIATIYWQWYAFYWTLNGAVLAWMYVKRGEEPLAERKHARQSIPYLFAFLTVLGVLASIGVAYAMFTMSRDTIVLARTIAGTLTSPVPEDALPILLNPTSPIWLNTGALLLTTVSLSGLLIVWIKVGELWSVSK
jgi:lipid-A-disaccharide synthase-like uncharacterized protein